MDVFRVTELAQLAWIYVALPLLAISGLALTVQLKAPQFRKLGDGMRALRRKRRDDAHDAPALTSFIGFAGQFGAAAAVASASAVALGGPGALPYLWLFALLLMPLRYAETLLAGTDAPGRGEAHESGSLPRRLLRMGGRFRLVGMLAVLTTLVAAFAFGGVLQADALERAAEPILPGSGRMMVLGAAGFGAALVLLGKRTASIIGWLGMFGLLVVLVCAIWMIGSAPGAALGAVTSGFASAFDGAPRFEAFGGAFVGEVAFAAMLHVLPAMSASTGIDGAAQSSAAAPMKGQAAASLYGPLVVALLGTLLTMAYVGTGAYGTRVESRIALPEATTFKVPANTSNERVDEERLFSGYMRIRDGVPRNPAITFGTGRGMIEDAMLLYDDRAADLALHARDGQAFRLLRSTGGASLNEVRKSELWRVEVAGQMPPRGGALVVASADSAGGDLLARLLLVGLMALGAVAFALFGLGASRALPTNVPSAAPALMTLLPLAGALVLLMLRPLGLVPLASLLTAIHVALIALLLLLRAGEVKKLQG